jgi:iron complex transport system ATP-binding protein
MSQAVLSFAGLSFSRESRPILTNISWSVAPRQIAAILGPNGCGKSTLLRLACGYLWPQAGAINLLGHTLGEYHLAELRTRLGIVEANTLYPFDDTMTTLDVVVSGYFSALTIGYVHPTAEQWDHARAMLTHVALADRAAQRYPTLSTGQRMRALIARALVRKPDLLLLDEPTAGLDLPGRESILATLARLHQRRPAPAHPSSSPSITRLPDDPITKSPPSPAIITVTHHLEELLPGTANILLLSAAGQTIAQGPPETVLTDAHMSAAFGVPIHITHRSGRYHAHVDPETWNALL